MQTDFKPFAPHTHHTGTGEKCKLNLEPGLEGETRKTGGTAADPKIRILKGLVVINVSH